MPCRFFPLLFLTRLYPLVYARGNVSRRSFIKGRIRFHKVSPPEQLDRSTRTPSFQDVIGTNNSLIRTSSPS